MITVVFSGNENVKNYITGLWQYDFGQVLRIQGLDLLTAVEIHFSLQETEGEAVTRIGTTKDGVTDVVIPDSMLENEDTEMDYNIYVFIYLTDEGSGETEKKITLKVKSRPRPEAFNSPEDGELFREVIKEVNNAADRAEEAEENASKYAAQTKQDAEQTAEDRREVERIVETVSDIGEHVDTVREYRDQAQTAATNALLSEQKAAETKETVIAAQAGAESAANAAEEYAEQTAQDATQTAEDRAEVERLVATVSGVSEQVEAIKEYKDQAQSAATNALLAENESKKAKEDALLAQAGAESAADEAERHALDVAGDKTEVERLAAQVREDKEAVEQSKTSVEETAQGFDQTVQQAKESINTDAAEKVSAVQNAGAQAVERVNTAKGEAVKAVEDKGVEQVQALEDKGKEIIESFPTAPDLDAKLDKQQGAENAGKALVIGNDGNVVAGEVQTSIEVDATLTQAGKAADAKAVGDKFLRFAIKNTANGKGVIRLKDSVEEKILDFKMQGRTEQEHETFANMFNANDISVSRSFTVGSQTSLGNSFSESTSKKYAATIHINVKANTAYTFRYFSSNYILAAVVETTGYANTSSMTLRAKHVLNEKGIVYNTEYLKFTTKESTNRLSMLFYTNDKTTAFTSAMAKDIKILLINNIFPKEELDVGMIEKLIPVPGPKIQREIVNAGTYSEEEQKYKYEITIYGENLISIDSSEKSQSITIGSEKAISKWDGLEKRNGIWGWIYKTGTLNLADVNEWQISDDSYFDNLTHRVYTDIPGVVPHAECYSNKLYPFGSGDLREIDYECVNIMNGQELQIKLLKKRGTTSEEIKAFFAESDIYVLYPTMNEEFVPLSDKEQNMLNNLHTYYPATVISNGEGCEMEVTYVADTTTYVNNKIAEIAAAALKGV